MEETNYVRTTSGSPGSASEGDTEKCATSNTHISRSATEDDVAAIPLRTFVQKLSLWQPTPGPSVFQRAVRCIKYLGWPVIFYAGFSYGSYLIWFNVLNATASIILGGPPYNFSSSIVGLSYLACTIGVIIGSLLSGRLSDWLTIKIARRNKGIMEAEHRLWPFVYSLLTLPSGLILWGVGAYHEVHWFGLMVAMAFVASNLTFGINLSVNYLIDSYHDISGDAIVAVIIVRNTMSFAVSYGITPWLTDLGYQNCFISAAFIGLAASSVFLIIVKYGKGLRIRSAKRYWELAQEERIRTNAVAE